MKYKNWNRANSIQLKKIKDNYYITQIFEKEVREKSDGTSIGIDIGVKKLLTTSREEYLGKDIEKIYENLTHKLRGSKNYSDLLSFKKQQINKICNELDLSKVKTVYVEDLKNVNKNTKKDKTRSTKQMNKQQYWAYRQVLDKLQSLCIEQGISLVKVSPAYTSQTCSRCKSIDKASRNGENYHCNTCGLLIDADYNAAINILHRGVYSPSDIEK